MVAIIGIMVALLLPAVQQGREAARRREGRRGIGTQRFLTPRFTTGSSGYDGEDRLVTYAV